MKLFKSLLILFVGLVLITDVVYAAPITARNSSASSMKNQIDQSANGLNAQGIIQNMAKSTQPVAENNMAATTTLDKDSIENQKRYMAFMKEYAGYLTPNQAGLFVTFKMTSIDQANVATYAVGLMKYDETAGIMEGSGSRYFDNINYLPDNWSYPFAYPQVRWPNEPKTTPPDRLILTLNVDRVAGKITTLDPSGDVTSGRNLDIRCQNGILYGFSDWHEMYIISLHLHHAAVPDIPQPVHI